MPYRTDLVYRYDGSYQGFLCCVFACFQHRELPLSIRPWEEAQQSLFGSREIPTQPELAQRVERSIPKRFPPWPWNGCARDFWPACPSGRWRCCGFCCWGTSGGRW